MISGHTTDTRAVLDVPAANHNGFQGSLARALRSKVGGIDVRPKSPRRPGEVYPESHLLEPYTTATDEPIKQARQGICPASPFSTTNHDVFRCNIIAVLCRFLAGPTVIIGTLHTQINSRGPRASHPSRARALERRRRPSNAIKGRLLHRRAKQHRHLWFRHLHPSLIGPHTSVYPSDSDSIRKIYID